MMTVAEQIKVLCVRCGISEAELARRLGKSPQSLNSKMKRESFTIKDMEEIASSLGITDVHIHHCIKDACGVDVSNDECQVLFTNAVAELKKDYPWITVAKLDGIIWRKYQRGK